MPLGTGGLQALWMTFLVGMTPVLELRGAIPLGVAAGLPPLTACAAAILGNIVPVPFIMLLVRRIFRWLRRTAFFGPKIDWLERRAHLKGRLVRKYRLPGLLLLVAVPLPGTGAWTGRWWRPFWTSACATPSRPSPRAWSSPASSSPS